MTSTSNGDGYFGPKVSTGGVYRMASGRMTTPAPVVDMTTPRKVVNTLKRVDHWVWENARKEAELRGLLFYADEPKGYPDKWPQACRDECNMILWSGCR